MTLQDIEKIYGLQAQALRQNWFGPSTRHVMLARIWAMNPIAKYQDLGLQWSEKWDGHEPHLWFIENIGHWLIHEVKEYSGHEPVTWYRKKDVSQWAYSLKEKNLWVLRPIWKSLRLRNEFGPLWVWNEFGPRSIFFLCKIMLKYHGLPRKIIPLWSEQKVNPNNIMNFNHWSNQRHKRS